MENEKSVWDEDVLEIKRKRMVDWSNPIQLAKTGIRTVLSTIFGQYADKREMQAGLAVKSYTYSRRKELWLDFVADTGDGWDSTFTIASLLAAPQLRVAGETLPRGDVLIMGGDMVYPAATQREYKERFLGPFFCALPYAEKPQPELYAIPGNHDWYDGLTHFTRLFCQQRWIGGWKTRQSRSYFALKLPHDWCLFAIDTQLGSDIDMPQIKYFEDVAKKLTKGTKIILVCAEPTWLFRGLNSEKDYKNLWYFQKRIIEKQGHEFVIGLAGDVHSYARYEGPAGKQRFVAGGGGAFMHANHNFPDELSLPSLDCAEAPPRVEEETYRAKRLFPTREKSKSMRWGALGFFLNNYSFSLLFGILYTFFFYMLQSRSRLQSGGTGTILDRLHEATNVWELPGIHFSVVIHAPNLILFLLIFLGGLIAMAESKKVGLRILQGVAHTLGHVAVFTLLSWGIVKLSFVIAQSCPTWLLVPVLALLTILLGSLAAGLVVGFYLALLPQHQLTYSSQAIKGYKNFLRLHIAEHGVTIYPIGVEKAHRKWRELEKPTSPHKTRSLPAADGEIACTLIETPITIPCHHGSGDEAHSGALDSGK